MTMVGLNHGCWGVEHDYDGQDPFPLPRRRGSGGGTTDARAAPRRQLELAGHGVGSGDYFEYYYFTDDVLTELRAKPTTRAEDILGWSAITGATTRSRRSRRSGARPGRSRGGIHELELAVDVIDALFNDKDEAAGEHAEPGGALPGFPDDLVVEVPGR